MSTLYKQYLKLLKKWPVDEYKNPDLGQHLRNQVKIVFSKGEQSIIPNEEQCRRNLESLNRIASNYYGDKYACKFKKTATGLSPEICSQALSPEIQKLLAKKKKGIFGRFKEKLKVFVQKSS